MAATSKKTTKTRKASKTASIKTANKFNLKVLLPVIALLAIGGVYFVWQSFAAEPKVYDYTHCKYGLNGNPVKNAMKASELPTDGGTACWEQYLKYGLAGSAPTSEVLARKAALAEWDAQHPAEWCKWQPDVNPPTIDCSTASTAAKSSTQSSSSSSSSSQSAKSQTSSQTKTTTSSGKGKSSTKVDKGDGTSSSGTSAPKGNGTR